MPHETNQTDDERARALVTKHYTEWHLSEAGPQHESFAALVTDVLAFARDERRRALEEAAKICHDMAIKEGFKNITGEEDEETMRKTCAWMMDQCAAAIRRQAEEEGHG